MDRHPLVRTLMLGRSDPKSLFSAAGRAEG
jgi:hypothetical protein